VLAILGAIAYWAPWRGQSSASSIRFEIQPTASMTFIDGGYPMVSPNGKWVVLPATGSDGVTRMWLRALDSVEVRALVGTETGNSLPPPVFWSPDSRFIAFSATPGPFAPGQLKKLDISGGPPQTICDVAAAVPGGAWNRDGVIVFAVNNAPGLLRVSAAGGAATLITMVDTAHQETAHRFPQFLPDGRHFLYLRVSSASERMGMFSGSIDAKPEEQSLKPVLLTDRQAKYAPALAGGLGQLLFLRDTTLFAQPFDPARLELSGEPIPVADQVGSFALANAGLFSASETGVLAFRVGAGGDQRQLTWFDPQGKVLGTVGDKGADDNPAISPDGTRIAVTQLDRQRGNSNIWVLDIARGGASTKVTFSAGRNDYAVWSPDGKSIAFASNRSGHLDLYQKNSDGSGEDILLLKSDEDKTPSSWSRDGRFLLYASLDPKTREDLWALPLQGDRKPVPILRTEFMEDEARISPDGRFIAYESTESGTPEIYARPYSPEKGSEAASGGKWLISKGGGVFPSWRGDGKELFYLTTSLQQMAVDVSAEKTFRAGVPRRLFNVGLLTPGDISTDGKRFLNAVPEGASAPSPFMVVTNWPAALKK
jgi:Tol biopolymer transport system component